jgi:hypothetical protein
MKLIRSIKNIGIVLAALLALIQVWTWLAKAFENDLTATVSYGAFTLPPGLAAEFERYHKLGQRRVLDSVVAQSLRTAHTLREQNLASRVLDEVSWFIEQNTSNEIPWDFSHLRGYWSVKVVNEGSRAIASVTMFLPYAARLLIARAGEAPVENKCEEVVRLGTLQPREEVSLFVWTTIPPSTYDIDQIKLTHADGVGRIHPLIPIGGLGRWVGNNLWLILYIAIMAAVVVLMVYSYSRQLSGPKDKSSTTPKHQTENAST